MKRTAFTISDWNVALRLGSGELRLPAQREGKAEWKVEIGVVSKTLSGNLFARNVAFPARPAGGRGMQRQCADRAMKMDCPLEVGFKADLILKV